MLVDYKENKGFRLLSLYERFDTGECMSKEALADEFNVSLKTIQRDIEDLRTYFAETHLMDGESEIEIKYDKRRRGFRLTRTQRTHLTQKEVLGVCKILLESRAFCKDELNLLIDKLLHGSVDEDKIKELILSERVNYVPLRHGQKLLDLIWELSLFIVNREIIEFTYTRQDGAERRHTVKPVALMFSEYYFYMITYMADETKDLPTVFRVDRLTALRGTSEKFSIPYSKRFSDGEFRKRVQFMYSGELRTVRFEYYGPSIEAVLDRLPTAQVTGEREEAGRHVYQVSAEVYGTGIDFWLRGQGDWVRVV
jgi:predicted DNA-binding transcriptional regulator YafY